MSRQLVEVQSLVKDFPVRGGVFKRARVNAVRNVSFGIAKSETIGVVGESGSGKSTVANIVAGLLPPTAGHVNIGGVDLATLRGGRLREARRNVQMVFQDPYTSVAPTSVVASSVLEPLRAHGVGSRLERHRRVDELFESVGLDNALKSRYPNELSGGQLQRVSIARALALEPSVMVLDEPVSALDVSTKAEIINLLADLKKHLGLTYLFISHDLSTLRVLADRLAVMYLGEIVEIGPASEIYDSPRHPYTRALLGSVPVPDPVIQRQRQRIVLEGDIPTPLDVPTGCSFHTRCPSAMPVCSQQSPPRVQVGSTDVACHLFTGEQAGGALPSARTVHARSGNGAVAELGEAMKSVRP